MSIYSNTDKKLIMTLELGSETLLEKTPTVLEVDGKRYILHTRDDGTHVLYTAICPHQRGRVMVDNEEMLLCPNHRWMFNPETGDCTTVPGESLASVPVRIENGKLYASRP